MCREMFTHWFIDSCFYLSDTFYAWILNYRPNHRPNLYDKFTYTQFNWFVLSMLRLNVSPMTMTTTSHVHTHTQTHKHGNMIFNRKQRLCVCVYIKLHTLFIHANCPCSPIWTDVCSQMSSKRDALSSHKICIQACV